MKLSLPQMRTCRMACIPFQLIFLSFLFIAFTVFSNSIFGQGNTCANATPLSISPYGTCATNAVDGTNSGATDTQGAPICDLNNGPWPDVFYSFNAGPYSTLNLSLTLGNMTDRIVEVFEGCGGTSIYCSVGFSSDYLTVNPNVEYIIRISSNEFYGDPGTFTLCLTAPEPPECTNPEFTLTAYAYGTTTPIDGCIAPNSLYYLVVEFPDDYGNTSYYLTFNNSIPFLFTPTFSVGFEFGAFSGAGGVEVTAIGIENNTCSTTEFFIPEICAPINDECTEAIALTVHAQGDCGGNEVTGETSGATSDGLSHNCEDSNPDVFYSFNSGDNTSVVINLEGITATDLVLTVLEGSCSGSNIYCASNFSSNTVEVVPNMNYILSVATNTSYGDLGSFNICVEDGYDCFDLQANFGDACDDGSPQTENDVLIEGCTCQGAPLNNACANAETLTVNDPGDCAGNETLGTTTGASPTLDSDCEATSPDVYYTFNAGSYENVIINLSAITATDLVISVLEGSCGSTAIYSCYIGTDQALNVDVNPDQTYTVRIHSLGFSSTGDFNICAEGVYNCPDLNANIGDACNDGNPNTINDMITSDCVCAGTIVYDCPSLSANFGDACNDGNPNTTNDVVTSDCTCEGTSIFDCPVLEANIGDACDDGDPYNLNDVITSDCICQGTPPNDDCSDAIVLNLNAPGECSENSTIGTTTGATPSDVEAGCQLDLTDVFYQFNSGSIYHKVHISLSAITATNVYMTFFSGGDCTSSSVYCGLVPDEGVTFNVNPETSYLIRVQAASIEEGTFNVCLEGVYDCPDLGLNINDACDDGDPNTENDVVTSSCTCEGTPASSGTLSGTIPSWNSNCGSRDVTIGLAQPAAGFYDELYGTLNADGSIDLDGSPEIIAGTYTVFVDVQGALVKRVGEVVISSGTNTFSVPPLTFGDLNNDNAINISDISQFITTFGSAIGDSNYDPLADFDCSGSINIADLSSLTNNFGLSGDHLAL